MYVDPVQRRARWKLVAMGARKKPSNGRRAAKSVWRRSVKTTKKHRNKQKSNTAKHQKQNWDGGGGEEEKGRGVQGLRTSSKLLEPNVKGMWRGGIAEAIPPPLQLRRFRRGRVVAG
jgi:hypothetical protein